ncbi:MAG: periplasmic heavy metal sensor [Bacteroidetes bacterium]|jgi:protein CpxP|nr:periplasmic heavy metal sensor [Bacteroidota bacterium]
MNKTKLYGILAIILLLINVAMGVFILTAKDKQPPMRENGPKKLIMERLAFDKEQKKEFRVMVRNHQEKMHEHREALMQAKVHLHQHLKGDNHADIDSLTTAIGHIHSEMEALHYAHFLDIKAICKPEQMNNYILLVDDLKDIFEKRRAKPRRKGR